jgi:serine/threonine protein kinase
LGFSQSIHNRVYKAVGTDGYKAPEIHLISRLDCNSEAIPQGYSGRQADIFALGVILFTLHFGVPPFTESTKDDRLYKLLTFKSNASDKRAALRFFLR